MSDMGLGEAWSVLGYDPAGISATISKRPRAERVAAAEKLAEKARRIAAKVSAPHHPDVGGDPEKFKRVWEAVSVIEASTADFRAKMADLDRRMAERAEKGPFIEIKK